MTNTILKNASAEIKRILSGVYYQFLFQKIKSMK